MEKEKVEISIIIPCYNAEKYINRCIDSILNQSYKNFELICVNDGSTDATLNILKEYEKNNSNMLVVSKKNEGGKNVTQTGLKYAKGKYICAIDNDDYIHKDYLKELHSSITKHKSDVAICGFQREIFETGKLISKEMNKKNGCYNISEDSSIILEINTSMWNKIYKREIFISLLDYRLDALAMGDMTLMIYMYSKIKKISFVNKILYYYQVRSNSNISSFKEGAIETVYDNLIRIKNEIYLKNKPEMLELFDAYVFLHLGISLMYRVYRSNLNFKEVYKKNLEILNEYFPKWKKNKYYSLGFILKNKFRNLKLFIAYIFYRIHLFKLFIGLYDFITTKLKFDIKW